MRNRLWNCNNPYQGEAQRVLCVCSAGLLRSPTAAVILATDYKFNTRAVGLDTGHALIPIDDVLLTWADEIICMSNDQKSDIIGMLNNIGSNHKVVTSLDIRDSFSYMEDGLQEIMREKFKVIFKEDKSE